MKPTFHDVRGIRVPLSRLRQFAVSNPLFAAALAAGAGLRLLAMLGYPGALWFAGDSYGAQDLPVRIAVQPDAAG
jgi:hypothetical protein